MLSKGYGARVFSCAKMRRGNAGAALRRPRSFSLHQPSTDHVPQRPRYHPDRKSTRLNSSHSQISYADFCLKEVEVLIEGRRRRSRAARDVDHLEIAVGILLQQVFVARQQLLPSRAPATHAESSIVRAQLLH